jgi:hypothetical protein
MAASVSSLSVLMEATMVERAVKKRGANAHVPEKPRHEKPQSSTERKLEQGLEESMAGSDPVSITQPTPVHPPKKKSPN